MAELVVIVLKSVNIHHGHTDRLARQPHFIFIVPPIVNTGQRICIKQVLEIKELLDKAIAPGIIDKWVVLQMFDVFDDRRLSVNGQRLRDDIIDVVIFKFKLADLAVFLKCPQRNAVFAMFVSVPNGKARAVLVHSGRFDTIFDVLHALCVQNANDGEQFLK